MTAIPKKSDKVGFHSLKHISLLSVTQKFLHPCFAVRCQSEKIHEINILGYELGKLIADVTATLRQVLRKAWLRLMSFHRVKHDDVEKALFQKGVHFESVSSLLRESSDLKGRINLPGAPMSSAFLYALGARQGSVEGPDMWNQVLDNSENLQVAGKRRMCVSCLPETTAKPKRGVAIHHLFWADDMYATAGTMNHLARTLENMTNAIEPLGMKWEKN